MSNLDPKEPNRNSNDLSDAIAGIVRQIRKRQIKATADFVDEEKHAEAQRHAEHVCNVFDWARCMIDFPLEWCERLAEERGVSTATIEGLWLRNLLGAYHVPKWGNALCIAFPIHGQNGYVARVHCRSPQRDSNGKWAWTYEPVDLHGERVSALVFGNLERAHNAYLLESTFDTVALIDKRALFPLIDAGEICLITTRGAEFGTRLRDLNLPPKIAPYAFPQNDEPGGKWLANVVGSVNGTEVRVVVTPKEFKDLNDWTRAGAGELELEDAIAGAEVYQEPTQPLRPMLSWIDYGDKEVDRSRYHIGEGFLEVCCYIFLVGPSYSGKSTLVAQLSTNFAVGRSCFIFKIQRPLRSLIVQAEDPENKLIKMGQMYRRMGLSKAEIKQAKENTAVLVIDDLQDTNAIAEIERHALAFKPDIIWLNPLTSYLSSGVYKDEAINKFLRVDFGPMLKRIGCSGVVAHHPPKPALGAKSLKDLTIFELQYGAAGMASLTNIARANVFLAHVDGDVFKLAPGKGYEELGVKECEVFLRRSRDEKGIMLWEECDQAEAEEATEKQEQRKAKEKKHDQFVPYERLLKVFKATQKYSRDKVRELAKKDLGKGRDWTDAAIRQLVLEKKLAKSKQKNPEGQSFVFYHLPTPLEPATNYQEDDSSDS
jgi:RecA-family ATPase